MLLRYQPYEFQILNRFDTFSNVSSMIVLGFGLPFRMDNFNPVLQTALMVFILILICSVIVVGIGAVSLECYKYFGLIKSNIRSSKMEKLASKPNSSSVMVGKCDPCNYISTILNQINPN
ncbi:hypothetical protein BKA69DRAFT_1086357 [Paraphysoderma sedebokerense]|nr:hypothetical protein BKA69DRAFT_1086357 [Paraphysoderma sedebokerense]